MEQAGEKPQLAALRFGRLDAGVEDVDSAIARACEYLLSRQLPEGYWNG